MNTQSDCKCTRSLVQRVAAPIGGEITSLTHIYTYIYTHALSLSLSLSLFIQAILSLSLSLVFSLDGPHVQEASSVALPFYMFVWFRFWFAVFGSVVHARDNSVDMAVVGIGGGGGGGDDDDDDARGDVILPAVVMLLVMVMLLLVVSRVLFLLLPLQMTDRAWQLC